MRRRKRIAATCAALLAAATITTAEAPSASAGTYHLFGYAYADANYQGGRTAIFTNAWIGPCDHTGYTYRFTRYYDPNTSSMKDATIGDRCNYVYLYDKYGHLCGNGAFHLSFVGAACNDKIASMRIFEDNRLPWRTK